MAEVALKLTEEAVCPETEAFREFCKLQMLKTFWIQFAAKMSNTGGRLGTYIHTHKQTTIPRAHAPSVNNMDFDPTSNVDDPGTIHAPIDLLDALLLA